MPGAGVLREAGWPLVGRGEEVELVGERLLDPGSGGVALVGSTGVGKTRLAREASAAAEAGGAAVRWATATHSAATVPFGAVAHLLPPAEISGASDMLRMLRSAAAAMAEDAGGQPLVVAIDDAHLLDGGSAALALQLALTGAATVLVTLRSGEPAPDAMIALWKDGHAARVDIQPLSETETASLVEAALEAPVERGTRRWIWDHSQGNPLFARELVTDAIAEGSLVLADGIWRLRGHPRAPARLSELLRERLGGLPAGARRMLELVALAAPLEQSIAESLESVDALELLEAEGLATVELDGPRRYVRASHPLYADVALDGLPNLRRQELLVALADAVEGCGARRAGDTMRIVSWRLDAGVEPGAALLLDGASEAHERFDHERAADLARRALDAGGGVAAALAHARACFSQGRFTEVLDTLTSCDEGELDESQAAEALTLRTQALQWGLRDEPGAIAALDEAETDHPGEPWSATVAGLRLNVLSDAGRLAEAVELADRLLPRLDLDAKRGLMAALSVPLAFRGRAREAIALTDEMTGAQPPDPKVSDWQLLMAWALPRLDTGHDWDRIEDIARRLHDLAAERRDEETAAMCELILGNIALERGRVQTAVRWLREAGLHFEVADPRALHTMTLAMLAWAHAHAGSMEAATTALRRAEESVATRPLTWVEETDFVRARAWIAAAAGDTPAAQRIALEGAERTGDVTLRCVHLLHEAVRLGYPAGKVVKRVDGLAAGMDAELVLAYADHVRALASRDAAALEAAAERFAAIGALLQAAEAAAEASLAYRSQGRQDSARRAAARSASLAGFCEGAETPALTATAELAELTPREREVAALAAGGSSNAEIAERVMLSVRSVETYVFRACKKLGVGKREDLAGLLR